MTQYVTLDAGLKVEVTTERAIMLTIRGESCWIPRKHIEEGDYIYRGMDSGNISSS